MFLVVFGKRQTSIPYVLKLHDRADIEKERQAVESVVPLFPEAIRGERPKYNTEQGVILYQHLGGITAREALDSTLLVDALDGPSTKRLTRMLDSLFRIGCKSAHDTKRRKHTSLLTEYRRYLRRPKMAGRSRSRICSMLGARANEKNIRFLGTNIVNPNYAIDVGFSDRRKIQVCGVHGDLHPNNVVIGKNDEPRLIDFAWASASGHFLKDFVLLELSLRFLEFPCQRNLDEQLKVDKMLLSENGADNVLKATIKSMPRNYDRLAELVKVIRSNARRVAPNDYNFHEYLAAQFLVLYGLMRYDNYNRPEVLRVLGMIAQKLSANSGFLKL